MIAQVEGDCTRRIVEANEGEEQKLDINQNGRKNCAVGTKLAGGEEEEAASTRRLQYQ